MPNSNRIQGRARAAAMLMSIAAGLACACGHAAAAAGHAAVAPDWHATVRDFAAKHFKNPAWGYSHCMRDYALARELAAADHVALDDDVLFAAAYLHDMAAFKPWEQEKLDHSDVAAGIVDTVLEGTGFPMAKIDAVRGAIRTHMYYRDPVGPEALYLRRSGKSAFPGRPRPSGAAQSRTGGISQGVEERNR